MMTRALHIVTTAWFLLVIYAVPSTQAYFDSREEEPVIQFLELFKHPPTEENLRDFEDTLEDRSYWEEKAREYYSMAEYRLFGYLGEKVIPAEGDFMFYAPGVRYLAEPYDRIASSAEPDEQPLDVIVDFRNQLRARGVELVVVPVPGKGSVYPDKLGPVAVTPEVYANTTRFIAELEAEGITVIRLHEALQNARLNSEARQYMLTDTHWTCAGAQVAARVIAEQLLAMPVVQKMDRSTKYRTKPESANRFGDLAEMTKLEGRKELFAEETYQCHRVVDSEGVEWFDDPDAPIMWIGDSFSRVFLYDEPYEAGVVPHVSKELQLPIYSIVNDGGASTLVREQLVRELDVLEGKKLLIWEFVERDLRFGMKGWEPIQLELPE